MTNHPFLLTPASVVRVLGTVAVLLVAASVAGQLFLYLAGYAHAHDHAIIQIFYVDSEKNLPTGFATVLLLFAALLLAVIAGLKWRQSGATAFHWAVLSLGFSFMAVDEAWSVHERLIRPMRRVLGYDNLGVFYYAWVVPAVVLVFVLGLFFWKFLMRLPAQTRRPFMLAAALYLGGAIGIELAGGKYDEAHGKLSLTYSMIVTVEESLEMAGVLLFIRTLLCYLADNYSEVRFRFGEAKGDAKAVG